MAILYIDKLIVMASIGMYDWEKQCLQKLIFDIQLTYKAQYFLSDMTIESYVDYTHINKIVLDIMKSQHFLLIEHVAETVSQILIEKFPKISRIRLKVNKPNALFNALSVGVCINKRKSKNSKN